ncbi:MAG TPA: 30S ribosomal protein S20 [Verrucomicrobiae bacterium]|jgi:small subunit ribosomal protein S20|nr:30S ribosomal protein S20 [Verrucomicrobiae bacterium]
MPIIKSAIKRAKQSLVRRSRNLQVKRAVKLDINSVSVALADGDAKDIQAKLNEAYSEIDRAVKKGTLHKNTAARRKSVLAHAVAKASGEEKTPVETKTTKGAGKKAVTTKATIKKTTATKAAAPKKAAVKKTPAKTTKTDK